jgi:hypothetical protein
VRGRTSSSTDTSATSACVSFYESLILRRAALADPVLFDQPGCCQSLSRRPQPFFLRMSLSAALSSIDSANRFLSRRFSSSSALSRFASDASMTPYLAFHLFDQPGYCQPSSRRPQPFFPRMSLSAALSSIDSANSFL